MNPIIVGSSVRFVSRVTPEMLAEVGPIDKSTGLGRNNGSARPEAYNNKIEQHEKMYGLRVDSLEVEGTIGTVVAPFTGNGKDNKGMATFQYIGKYKKVRTLYVPIACLEVVVDFKVGQTVVLAHQPTLSMIQNSHPQQELDWINAWANQHGIEFGKARGVIVENHVYSRKILVRIFSINQEKLVPVGCLKLAPEIISV